MELKSQEMRKLAPELDPLRIGTGWRKEDLEKPQVMIESTFGDSHPGREKELSRPADMVPDISARIYVTVRARERTELTTVLQAAR